MANTLQLKRGTTASNDLFVGLSGEVTMDTTKKTLRVHDGVTKGGTELATAKSVKDVVDSLNYVPSTGGTFTGNVTAPTFVGSLTGKADTAGTADSANAVAWSKVTGKPSTFAPSTHTHNYAGSTTAGGAADKVANTVIFTNDNTGAAAGAEYDGSAKRIVTYLTVGAAKAGHTHNYAGSSSAGGKATSAASADTAAACTGNAATATKLATARTIALSGGATGTATSFNGTANITIPVTSLDATKLSGTASINTTGKATTAGTADSAKACTGNAATATKLATARNLTIKDSTSTNSGTAVSFDGSGAITLLLPATIAAALSGNASTATKLKTARTITVKTTDISTTGSGKYSRYEVRSGQSGSASFNGSGDITISVPLLEVTKYNCEYATTDNCFVEGKLLTVSGYKNITEITSNDTVVDIEGVEHKVLYTKCAKVPETKLVVEYCGCKMTEDHTVLTHNGTATFSSIEQASQYLNITNNGKVIGRYLESPTRLLPVNRFNFVDGDFTEYMFVVESTVPVFVPMQALDGNDTCIVQLAVKD